LVCVKCCDFRGNGKMQISPRVIRIYICQSETLLIRGVIGREI
jgi:hypothetical protein